MLSLADPRKSNPVLAAIDLTNNDRIVSIKETSTADSNFIVSHLIKQILFENNKLCLVNFHNPLEHYQYVGKKLGYDLNKSITQRHANIVEPLTDIVESIGLDEDYFQDDKENVLKGLWCHIKNNIDDLLGSNQSKVYLIVDDVSHLLDLGVDIELIVNFINYCVNLIDNDRITVIIGSHVSSTLDQIIVNSLQYIADINVEVSSLKTGKSLDVTGLLTVQRTSEKIQQYQYKAFDRGIKTFHPGESILNLKK